MTKKKDDQSLALRSDEERTVEAFRFRGEVAGEFVRLEAFGHERDLRRARDEEVGRLRARVAELEAEEATGSRDYLQLVDQSDGHAMRADRAEGRVAELEAEEATGGRDYLKLVDQCDGHAMRADRAEDRVAELEAVLRLAEWVSCDMYRVCPTCEGFHDIGHEDGCALAAALQGATEDEGTIAAAPPCDGQLRERVPRCDPGASGGATPGAPPPVSLDAESTAPESKASVRIKVTATPEQFKKLMRDAALTGRVLDATTTSFDATVEEVPGLRRMRVVRSADEGGEGCGVVAYDCAHGQYTNYRDACELIGIEKARAERAEHAIASGFLERALECSVHDPLAHRCVPRAEVSALREAWEDEKAKTAVLIGLLSEVRGGNCHVWIGDESDDPATFSDGLPVLMDGATVRRLCAGSGSKAMEPQSISSDAGETTEGGAS